jgi:hypothetical protein
MRQSRFASDEPKIHRHPKFVSGRGNAPRGVQLRWRATPSRPRGWGPCRRPAAGSSGWNPTLFCGPLDRLRMPACGPSRAWAAPAGAGPLSGEHRQRPRPAAVAGPTLAASRGAENEFATHSGVGKSAKVGAKLSLATSRKPWRRRRPSTWPVRCRSGGRSSGRARWPARS